VLFRSCLALVYTLYVVYDTANEEPVVSVTFPRSATSGKSLVHCSSARICKLLPFIIWTIPSLTVNTQKIKDIPKAKVNILFCNEFKVYFFKSAPKEPRYPITQTVKPIRRFLIISWIFKW